MPIYEYLCEQCGKRSEVLQRLQDAPLTLCDECGGALRKLVSAPSFQFKGSGWYVTDYAKGDKSAAGAAGKSDDKGESKGESKAEAKDSSSSGEAKSPSGEASGGASSSPPPASSPSSSSGDS